MAWMDMGRGKRLLAAIGLTGAILLGGCAYDDYGYGGVGAGYYGGGGYYDGYGGGYYQPGYYGGWYNDYYYPGSGYYVYDRGGKRHRWNNGQRAYWEGRRNEGRGRDRDNDGRWNGGRPGNDGRPDNNNNNWRNDRMQVPPQQQGRPWRGPRPDGVTEGTPRQEGARPTWRGNGNSGRGQSDGAGTGARSGAQSQEWRSNRMITPPQQQGRPWRNSRNPRN